MLLDCVLGVPSGAPAAAAPCPRAAVIGICKNAGKTVALNHMVAEADARGLRLALVSSGRDGEAKDAVTELPKPRIHVPAGTWLATARAALTPAVAVLAELPLATALGPVVLGRAAADGEMILVSPGSNQRLAVVLAELEARGRAAGDPPALALVDGAFDRLAAAAPWLVDAVVLAVGAAYSPSQKQTLAQAAFLLDVLRLPPALTGYTPAPPAAAGTAGDLAHPLVPGAAGPATGQGDPVAPAHAAGGRALDLAALDAALAAGQPTLLLPGAPPRPLGISSALAHAPELLAACDAALSAGGDAPAALALPGAFGDGLLQAWLLNFRHLIGRLSVVLPDATHVLAHRDLWRRWRQLGGVALVRRPVRVAAITANPHSPMGASYEPAAFCQALYEMAQGLPVFDLVQGLQCI